MKDMRMVDLPEGFDLEALLAPIPGDAPQGIDIREDFSAPRHTTGCAMPAPRRATQSAGMDAGRLPMYAIRPRSGAGSRARTEGAGGNDEGPGGRRLADRSAGAQPWACRARRGSQLIAGLAERYWDGIFPLPDDYGMETRVAPVTGLNGRDGNGSLIQPLHKLALVQPARRFADRLSTSIEQSEQLGTLDAERRQQRIDAGAVPFEDLWNVRHALQAVGILRHCSPMRGPRATPGRRWRPSWTRRQATMGLPRRRCAICCPASSRWPPAMRQPMRPAPMPRRPGHAAGDDGRRLRRAGRRGFCRQAASPGQVSSREDALRALERDRQLLSSHRAAFTALLHAR